MAGTLAVPHPDALSKHSGLPSAAIARQLLVDGWPPVWWVGCHGGAGTTTLVTVTGIGVDAGAAWPVPEPAGQEARVVLVCRATAAGSLAATSAVEQWRRHAVPPGTTLLGVVAVAASARRPPRRAAERLRLLAGWAPAVWHVGWVEEYLAADDARDVGLQPALAAVRHALSAKV